MSGNDIIPYLLGYKKGYADGSSGGGTDIDYDVVEYITSSGTQYIDSGVKITANTKIEYTSQLTATSGAQFGYLTASDNSRFFVSTNFVGGQSILTLFYNGETINSTTLYNTKVTYEISSDTFKINNETIGTYTQDTFEDLNMFIFAGNKSGTVSGFAKMKLFSFKIWEGNTLVRDFEPVLLLGAYACLHDKVENKFYANKGTGVFEAGSIITE